jgi:predicted GNAT family acetyltransferase
MEITAEVRHDEGRQRYELFVGEALVGHLDYRRDAEGRLVFVHTEVDEGHQGEGLAGRLVRGALEDVRGRGERVVAQCPYVRRFFHRHPEYADVVVGELGPSGG